MFTGIVTDIGTVRNVEQRGDLRLTIATAFPVGEIALGASIACSGTCLTVVDKGDDWFAVDVSAETVARTAGRLWQEGARLNLERSLRMGDELGGHIVTGHIDAVGDVVALSPQGDSTRLDVKVRASIAPMIAQKGSIALDGVSLTVNDVTDGEDGSCTFGINLIPHTASHTTLGDLAVGEHLNVEIDTLARYLARLTALKSH